MHQQPTRTRYHILVLSFIVALVMYLDRAAMGKATTTIMNEFGVDKVTMGWSVSAFNWTYAIFQIPGGWLADRFGSRLVLALAITWWSIFTAATGLAGNAGSMAVMRGLFGMGEAAAWPAASRGLVRWLPASLRGFGQGFQHSGARLGAALAPVTVADLVAAWGGRMVFYIFGAGGVLLSAVWYRYYRDLPRDHPSVNAAELELLGGAKAAAVKRVVPWGLILRSRDLWFLSILYFCYGWVFWMYLQWLPTYLTEARHFSELQAGLGASLPLAGATLANIAGGWISDHLSRAWADLRRGRVFVSIVGFLVAGAAILPGALVESAAVSIACLTIAMAALELTVAVSWAICLDISGDFSGSVTGVMNTLGNIGGAVSAVAIPYIEKGYSWTVAFAVCGVMCLAAAALATRIDPRRSAVAE